MGDLKIDLKFASKAQYWGCQGDCNILTIGRANQADVFMLLS